MFALGHVWTILEMAHVLTSKPCPEPWVSKLLKMLTYLPAIMRSTSSLLVMFWLFCCLRIFLFGMAARSRATVSGLSQLACRFPLIGDFGLGPFFFFPFDDTSCWNYWNILLNWPSCNFWPIECGYGRAGRMSLGFSGCGLGKAALCESPPPPPPLYGGR